MTLRYNQEVLGKPALQVKKSFGCVFRLPLLPVTLFCRYLVVDGSISPFRGGASTKVYCESRLRFNSLAVVSLSMPPVDAFVLLFASQTGEHRAFSSDGIARTRPNGHGGKKQAAGVCTYSAFRSQSMDA